MGLDLSSASTISLSFALIASQLSEDDDDDRDQDLLGDGGVERAEGLVDQARPVVERHDADLRDRAVGERLAG